MPPDHMSISIISSVLLMSLGTDVVRLENVELAQAMNVLLEEHLSSTGFDLDDE